MAKTLNELAAYEAGIIAGAVVWTTFCRIGPFRVEKTEQATREAAIAEAELVALDLGRNVLVYAVNAEGRDTLAGYVRPDGRFVNAARG